MAVDVKEITERVKQEGAFLDELRAEIHKVIVGQDYLIDRLLMGLLANGHILVEGVPGLAKTLTVSTLARVIDAKFQRIQFTPDLLPADIVGTLIYNQRTAEFVVKQGPIFANIILADEINRAPAKVQSALLEAMQERQVTIGEHTFKLDEPFLVLATQNPIEQEGTYPLPEAQVDRFMMKLNVSYPSKKDEREILDRMAHPTVGFDVRRVLTPKDIVRLRGIVDTIYIDEKLKDYILNIVFASREPEAYKIDIKDYVAYGASPRATIYLTIAAKTHAFLQRRGYVTPQDIKSVGADVLRHRIIVTYEAEAEDLTSEHIIQRIFDSVEVP